MLSREHRGQLFRCASGPRHAVPQARPRAQLRHQLMRSPASTTVSNRKRYLEVFLVMSERHESGRRVQLKTGNIAIGLSACPNRVDRTRPHAQDMPPRAAAPSCPGLSSPESSANSGWNIGSGFDSRSSNWWSKMALSTDLPQHHQSRNARWCERHGAKGQGAPVLRLRHTRATDMHDRCLFDVETRGLASCSRTRLRPRPTYAGQSNPRQNVCDLRGRWCAW